MNDLHELNGKKSYFCKYEENAVVEAIKENTEEAKLGRGVMEEVRDQNNKYFKWAFAALLILALGREGLKEFKETFGITSTASAQVPK